MRVQYLIINSMDENRITESNMELINYRLKSIEDSIVELKTLLVDVPRLNDRLVVTEKQSQENKDEIENIKKTVQDIKNQPLQKDANRWRYILDYIFKSVVAVAVIYFLSKIGVNVK